MQTPNSAPIVAAPKGGPWETGAIAARLLLGCLFVYMGFSKAVHPEAFLKLVRQYDLVSSAVWLNAIAAGLPWFEVFCGVLLLLGVAVRGAALMLVAMLVPFTLLVAHRAWGIAGAQHLAYCMVKFDCGCGTGEVLICRKILENLGLLVLSCWLVSGRGHRFCSRFALFPSKLRDDQPKLG